MSKKNLVLFIAATAVLVLAVVLALVLFSCGGPGSEPGVTTQATVGGAEPSATGTTESVPPQTSTETDAAGDQLHTVTVLDEKEHPLEKIGVYVYTDVTQTELVWFNTTDAQGVMTFEAPASDTYVAVLSDVPELYVAQELYPLTGLETVLVLEGYKDPEYKLGDKMEDFTVVDSDGVEYTLSELLKTKKAVVLNFWYMSCVPCKLEFPYMNEAYQDYRDKLEILAMSPIDVNKDIAGFKETNLLTFPMAECEFKWEKMMQITGYPTTVVIDRNGIISFIHSSYIDNADDFRKLFAFFTADEYEATLVSSLEELPELEEEQTGTAENPTEVGAVSSFEITVEPEQEVHVDLYRATNRWLQINDPDAYVIYNDVKYEAKNGSVGLLVSSPDNYSPAKLIFGSKSDKTITYTVHLSALPGTIDNPYTLVLGETKVSISAGNEQGVYYQYRATEDGELTLTCKSATAGVNYDCILNRVMAGDVVVVRSISETGGSQAVTTQVKKGETVKIIFNTLPDENFNYPGGTFVYEATFKAGQVEDTQKVEKVTYQVTVEDGQGNPIGNVNMFFTAGEDRHPAATGAEGVASVQLEKNTYQVQLVIPEGYTAQTTELTLTPEKLTAKVVLDKKVLQTFTYTVTVCNKTGQPLKGAVVQLGSQVLTTGNDGKVSAQLQEGSFDPAELSAAIFVAPEGYARPAGSVKFGDKKSLTFTLEIQTYVEPEPIRVDRKSYVHKNVTPGQSQRFDLLDSANMILTVSGQGGSVLYNGNTYPAQEGKVTITLGGDSTNRITLTNNGQLGDFELLLTYPLGHKSNPYVQEALADWTAVLTAAHRSGYYSNWQAAQDGFVLLNVAQLPVDTQCRLVLTNERSEQVLELEPDGIKDAWGNTWLVMEVFADDRLNLVIHTSDTDNAFVPGSVQLAAKATGYPQGHSKNPHVTDSLEDLAADVTVAHGGRYVYTWTAENDGFVSFAPAQMGDDVQWDVQVTNADVTVTYQTHKTQTLAGTQRLKCLVQAGDRLTVEVLTDRAAPITLDSGFQLHPVGNVRNPETLSQMVPHTVTLTDDHEEGYYTTWAAEEKGLLTLRMDPAAAVDADALETLWELRLENKTSGQILSYLTDSVDDGTGSKVLSTVVNKGDVLLLQYLPTQGDLIVTGASADVNANYTIYPVGSLENPEKLAQLGDLVRAFQAGHTGGYYYTWTASDDGAVLGRLNEVNAGAGWELTLTNVSSGAKAVFSQDALYDNENALTISLEVAAGDVLLIQLKTFDPAASDKDTAVESTLSVNTRFAAVAEELKADYKVTVANSVTNDLTDLRVRFLRSGIQVGELTDLDSNGAATARLVPGTYTAELVGVPAALTYVSITLTQENPNGTIVLLDNTQDYTVNIIRDDYTGNVKLTFLDGSSQPVETQTTADNAVTVRLVKGSYTVKVEPADPYVVCQNVSLTQAAPTANAALTNTAAWYTVNVTGYSGNVNITFRDSGSNVATPIATNGNRYRLPKGTYTVHLSSTDADWVYYKWQAATVTVDSSTADIDLMDTRVEYTVLLKKDGSAYTGSVTVVILDEAGLPMHTETVTTGTLRVKLVKAKYTVEIRDIADQAVGYTGADGILTETTTSVTMVLTANVQPITYTVTVVDSTGAAQKDLYIQILDGEEPLEPKMTDANGMVYFSLPPKNYSVRLYGSDAYYNKNGAILTSAITNLTITLAAEPDPAKTEAISPSDNQVVDLYVLDEGTTHLKITNAMSYYVAKYDDHCMFAFTPSRYGIFRISLDNPNVKLSKYNSSFFITYQGCAADEEDNALYFSVLAGQEGHVSYVLGIQVTEGVTDVAVNIKWVGETAPSVEDLPVDDSWMSGYVPTQYTMPDTTGKTKKQVNVMSADPFPVVLGDDGFYHVGTASGPLLYMDLGPTAPYYSLCTAMTNTGSLAPMLMRGYFYDENGVIIRKEYYTDLVISYIECRDTKTNLYPMTQDLAYALQNASVCKAWWDPTNPGYGSADNNPLYGSNPEIAWMFACYYFE